MILRQPIWVRDVSTNSTGKWYLVSRFVFDFARTVVPC